jgi:hypothetical protein
VAHRPGLGQPDAAGAAEGETADERLRSRVANARTLLTVAAVIMSGYLIATTLITTVLGGGRVGTARHKCPVVE